MILMTPYLCRGLQPGGDRHRRPGQQERERERPQHRDPRRAPLGVTLGIIFQNIIKVTEVNKFPVVLQLFKIMMMLLEIQSIKTISQGPTVKVKVNMITKPPLL